MQKAFLTPTFAILYLKSIYYIHKKEKIHTRNALSNLNIIE